MKVLLLLSCLLLAFSAHSSPEEFAGSWMGKGTYIFDGDLTQCSQMQMVFSATEDTFTFEAGQRVCEKHSEEFYRVDMRYADGRFYIGDLVVGTYDGEVIKLAFRAPDGDTFRNWRMSMRRTGDHLMYEENRVMDGEDTPLISFAGLLTKQSEGN